MTSPSTSGASALRLPFIGRERERELLVAALEDGSRLVTIFGPSGMGKTRLAHQLMQAMEPHLGGLGGVRFCSLAPSQTLADAEAAIARSLGLSLPLDFQGPAEFASSGPTLLIVDNADSFAAELAPFIGALLDRLGDLQLVFTSVATLGVPDEVRFELGPLEISDAMTLYLDRIRRAWPEREDPQGEGAVIEELVHRLDRIPLAIELAAARVRLLPPRELLSRLDLRFEILRGKRRDRHGSLFSALSITWELLSAEEKAGLSALSVFAGGFSFEAARAILEGVGSANVIDLLDGLRSKGFLQIEEGVAVRYTLYESVREFAALQFDPPTAADDVAARHAAWFLARAEEHEAQLSGPEAPASTHWLLGEYENLLAVFRRTQADDPETASRIGLALAAVLELRGSFALEREILDQLVEVSARADDPRGRIRALRLRAESSVRQGEVGRARDDLDEGLELAALPEDLLQKGYLLSARAVLDAEEGELERGRAGQEEALRIAHEEGDPTLEALCLIGLGMVEISRSSFERAGELIEEALKISRRHGNPKMIARSLLDLGVVHANQNRFRRAREELNEARGIFQALANVASHACVLFNLGGIELLAGLPDEAEVHTRDAFFLSPGGGFKTFEAQGVVTLGLIALEREEFGLARQRLGEAVAMHGRASDRGRMNRALVYLAAADAAAGFLAEARRNLDEARTFFLQVDDPLSLEAVEACEGLLDLASGRLLVASGKTAEAQAARARAQARLTAAAASGGRDVRLLAAIRRFLERALEERGWDPAVRGLGALVVGPAASWFELQGSRDRIDLRRRHAMRRILDLLITRRLDSPGVVTSADELFAVGWQGETAAQEAATRRVYTAIWALRSLGLAELIVREGDGYLIDPSFTVAREE